jgi:hypothetical protein
MHSSGMGGRGVGRVGVVTTSGAAEEVVVEESEGDASVTCVYVPLENEQHPYPTLAPAPAPTANATATATSRKLQCFGAPRADRPLQILGIGPARTGSTLLAGWLRTTSTRPTLNLLILFLLRMHRTFVRV